MTAATIHQLRRHFFSLPNILSSQKHYSERKLLKFSQSQLYNVVSNVDDYYLFVPFCTESKVYSTQSVNKGSKVVEVMKAELSVGFQPFQERYMSEVTCDKPISVKAVAADATLFKDMSTTWKFTPNVTDLKSATAADHPSCWVDFEIVFDFASPVHAQASSVFFDKVSKMTLQAFVDRCNTVYRS
ncbi:dehydrase and lipid transport-domain-containing protein [Pilobolus umbonatus]|nr:dehydrase and lipid transport-domain-containing protein [Pilobolus umbonatus]